VLNLLQKCTVKTVLNHENVILLMFLKCFHNTSLSLLRFILRFAGEMSTFLCRHI